MSLIKTCFNLFGKKKEKVSSIVVTKAVKQTLFVKPSHIEIEIIKNFPRKFQKYVFYIRGAEEEIKFNISTSATKREIVKNILHTFKYWDLPENQQRFIIKDVFRILRTKKEEDWPKEITTYTCYDDDYD